MCEGCAGYTENWLYTHHWYCTHPSTIEPTIIERIPMIIAGISLLKLAMEMIPSGDKKTR